MREIYKGRVALTPRCLDTANVLYLDEEGQEEWDIFPPLAENIQEDIRIGGNYLIVQYCLADAPIHTLDEAQGMRLEGRSYARYETFYDEWEHSNGETEIIFEGFFEELEIGDTDFLQELKMHVGKYLYLVIDYYSFLLSCAT